MCCGFKSKKTICIRKHHTSLHSWFNGYDENRNNNSRGRYFHNRYRHSGTNCNQQQATNIMNDAQVNGVAVSQPSVNDVILSAPTINQLPPQQTSNSQRNVGVSQAAFGHSSQGDQSKDMSFYPYNSSRQVHAIKDCKVQRSVKMFRNRFFGKDGYAVGYSMGDSGSEVTLLRESLRKMLGLDGEKCKLAIQWTDGTVKQVSAVKVDLEVQGVHKDSEKIMLRNCYAVSDLCLASRSLDVASLKR